MQKAITAINDYIFVKLYQWTDFLNRINRKYRIAWEDDCLWNAIFGLAVLQTFSMFSVILWLLFFTGYLKPLMALEDIARIVYVAMYGIPMAFYYYKNKRRYTYAYLKKIKRSYQKRSNVGAIILFIAVWAFVIFTAAYTSQH